jgi:BspA type Leucine rich repeat region (6 copies)
MKTKTILRGLATAVVLQLGVLAGSAQDAYSTNADGSIYTYSTNADGSANIVAYAGPPWVVSIPTHINGLTVTTIGEAAFQVISLINVTIPGSVTSIGDYAFSQCYSLTNVTIPNSVTNIGEAAFGGSGIINVTIPNSITSIGDYAFSQCASLTSVTILNSVTSIGVGVFQYCTSLTSVTIGNSVIGENEFAQCYSLTNVTIGNSVTSIGDGGVGAFFQCYSLTGVYFQGNSPSPTNDSFVFYADPATVYYLPGTMGWGAMFDGLPTAPWFLPNPVILNREPNFGVQPGGFGFIISWATNASVVVQAATNLVNPVWLPVSTNPLTGGTSYFSDPQWTNYPERFYRAFYQAASAFTVGGTVTGLSAWDFITLQDGSDSLTLSTNGTFTFPTALPNGHAYSVTLYTTSGQVACTFSNGSGTISGANVTNIAVSCHDGCPAYTGNLDVDMYNAAVSDGTANGGVPAVMLTENGGPFRVTAAEVWATCSIDMARTYAGRCVFTHVVGTTSCSSTTLPAGTPVIQFGGLLQCGDPSYGY